MTRLTAALTSRAVSLANEVKKRLGLLQYYWDIRPKPMLTHWGRVTYICVSKLSHYWTLDNGLAPIQCQTMIWSDIVWSTAPLGTKEVQFQSKFKHFYSRKCIWKCHLQNGIYFTSASICLIKSSEISFARNTHFRCRLILKRETRRWYSRTLCKI